LDIDFFFSSFNFFLYGIGGGALFSSGLTRIFNLSKNVPKFNFASGAEQSTATNAVQKEVKRAEKKVDIQ
jgi:hypothetical protein